jgi:undecaprenyl-diphosphatase
MNNKLFFAINNFAGKHHFLDVLGIFFADKFLYVFLLVVAALWLNKSLRKYVYLAATSVVINRLILVELLKRFFNHPRPYEILPKLNLLLVDNERGMSFPSGHAVIYFSLAFSFWGTKYFWPFFIFATIGSVARVYVGVHFPYDIIGSFIVAFFMVWWFRSLFKDYFGKNKIAENPFANID